MLVLAAVRAGGQPVPADRLAAHAVAALAIGHTVTADLHDERWSIVGDGLAHGAGLVLWAGRQSARGALTDDEHAAVLAMAVGGAR